MKKQTIYLMLLAVLFVAVSCSKDEPIESVEQTILPDEILKSEVINAYAFNKINAFDFIKSQPLNSTLNKKSGDKDAKPFWTSVYSNFFNEQGYVTSQIFIEGTPLLMIWDYPINGEDRIHVMGDYGKHVWNIKQPKVFIVDFSTGVGLVKYSNWCEENRTGFFKQSISGLIDKIDLDGDGEIDIWPIDSFHPESNGFGHIKTTLTDAQNSLPNEYPVQGENCRESTTEINFDVKGFIKNGVITLKVVLGEEKYEFII
ncbi:hypothetical protein [Algibacter sp.]|uniref:hypothetical protein n=1 Tax=Algibacter sp. TaxID=1872428 RepID=UPI003C76B618